MPDSKSLRKYKRENKAFNGPKQSKLSESPDTPKKERCLKLGNRKDKSQ